MNEDARDYVVEPSRVVLPETATVEQLRARRVQCVNAALTLIPAEHRDEFAVNFSSQATNLIHSTQVKELSDLIAEIYEIDRVMWEMQRSTDGPNTMSAP